MPPVQTPQAPTSAEIETASIELTSPVLEDAFGVLHHTARTRAVAPATALPGQYLAFADAAGEEHLIPLNSNLIHIGRSPGAEIRIEDIHVSRRHAIVSRYAGQVRVLDDASSAGTYVNGHSVVAVNLSHGDVIRLGPVTFTYVVVH